MERGLPPWSKFAALAAVGIGAILLMAALSEVATLLVVAALLAYLLDPLASRLEARGLSRTAATTVLFAGLTLALGAFLFLLFPVVAAQIQAIQTGFNADRARVLIQALEQQLEDRLALLGVGDLDIPGALQRFVARYLEDALRYVPGVLSLTVQLAVIPFLLFFLLRDGRRIKKSFVNLIPNRYFEFTLNVLHKTDVQLGNYLRGQLIETLVVAVLSIAALWLLGVDYYVVIGLFAGLTNLIPYLGPVAGATAAALVSVVTTGTFDTVVPIIAAFVLIQGIDNFGVQPVVLARNVKLHPVLILLSLLVAGRFFGFLGLLLAVPVTAVLKMFVQETLDTLRRYRLT